MICNQISYDFYSFKFVKLCFWRRQWHPTPVLLPGKSHRRRSLVGCSPWGCRVAHDRATLLSLFTFMHWRRKWQPTPVFLPGESQGRGSLVGCRLWGHRVGHDWSDLAAAARCVLWSKMLLVSLRSIFIFFIQLFCIFYYVVG